MRENKFACAQPSPRLSPPEPLDRLMQHLQPEAGSIKDGHTVQAITAWLLAAAELHGAAARAAGQLQDHLQQGEGREGTREMWKALRCGAEGEHIDHTHCTEQQCMLARWSFP